MYYSLNLPCLAINQTFRLYLFVSLVAISSIPFSNPSIFIRPMKENPSVLGECTPNIPLTVFNIDLPNLLSYQVPNYLCFLIPSHNPFMRFPPTSFIIDGTCLKKSNIDFINFGIISKTFGIDFKIPSARPIIN